MCVFLLWFSSQFWLFFWFCFVFFVLCYFWKMWLGAWFLQCFLRFQPLWRSCFFWIFCSISLPFFLWFFVQILHKNQRKIDKKCAPKRNSHWKAIFCTFWLNFSIFGRFWKILGCPGEAIGANFSHFWGAKIRANFERIFERIFSDSRGWAMTTAVACLRPFRPLLACPWGMAMVRS